MKDEKNSSFIPHPSSFCGRSAFPRAVRRPWPIVRSLRPPMPPIVVVQHMPPSSPNRWPGDSIRSANCPSARPPTGTCCSRTSPDAPGGKHLQVRRRACGEGGDPDGPVVSGHKPSVDVMMNSVARPSAANCLGVIMTGMGRDGADGCRAIRAAGGYVLGQDEATSDVYGMNKVAFVEGNIDRQFALDDAAAVIAHHVRRLRAAAAV